MASPSIPSKEPTPAPSARTPPQSQPINNTWIRRFLTLAAITAANRFMKCNGKVMKLSSRFYVKHGTFVTLAEASAMQFVAQHSSVPVPKVYCAFERRGCTYIVMERIDGDMIGNRWNKRSESSKARLLNQLKHFMEELRAIPPPEGCGVSNVDGGPLYDGRLPGTGSEQHGPFESVQEFHRYLRSDFTVHPNQEPELNELIGLQKQPWPGPTFTHGDLSSWNIIAKGDDVVGIIDWETAGWLPSYWEYTTACQVHPFNDFWAHEIDNFLESNDTAARMELLRQRYFGLF